MPDDEHAHEPKRRKRNSIPRCCRVDQRTKAIVYSPQRAIKMFNDRELSVDIVGPQNESRSCDIEGAQLALQKLYTHLQKTKLPKQNRENISDKPVRGVVLGEMFMLAATVGAKRKHTMKQTKPTTKLHELYDAASQLIKAHDPSFEWTAVQINKVDYESKVHVDRRNIGASYIIALGDFNHGGELQVTDRKINIHNRLLKFHGQLPHRALPHAAGVRYSLVFFTSSAPGGTILDKSGTDLFGMCTNTSTIVLHPSQLIMPLPELAALPVLPVLLAEHETPAATSPPAMPSQAEFGVWDKMDVIAKVWEAHAGPRKPRDTKDLAIALNHAAYAKHTWKPPSTRAKWERMLLQAYHYIKRTPAIDVFL